MRRLAWLVAAGALMPCLASGEQILLKSGGRIEGVLLERTPTRIVLQVGPGQVTLPLSSVERIVEGRSPLSAYAERAARLSTDDRNGWLDLGVWARDAGLDTQARECFGRVLALDPQNPLAQAGTGNVLLNGRWVTPEESYRARGYVRFEGSWMLPEERDEALRDRAERRVEAQARAESRARIEVAEAEARAAEAAARQMEAAQSGIPLGYAYGGYSYGGYGYRGYGSGYDGYGSGRYTRGSRGLAGDGIGNGRHFPGRSANQDPVRVPTSSWGPAQSPPSAQQQPAARTQPAAQQRNGTQSGQSRRH